MDNRAETFFNKLRMNSSTAKILIEDEPDITNEEILDSLIFLKDEDILLVESFYNNEEIEDYPSLLSSLNYLADDRSIDIVLEKLYFEDNSLNMLYKDGQNLTTVPEEKFVDFMKKMKHLLWFLAVVTIQLL